MTCVVPPPSYHGHSAITAEHRHATGNFFERLARLIGLASLDALFDEAHVERQRTGGGGVATRVVVRRATGANPSESRPGQNGRATARFNTLVTRFEDLGSIEEWAAHIRALLPSGLGAFDPTRLAGPERASDSVGVEVLNFTYREYREELAKDFTASRSFLATCDTSRMYEIT